VTTSVAPIDSDAVSELAILDVTPAPDLRDGSCVGTDAESWLPDSNDAMAVRILRRVCAGCSCREACAEWALSQPSWLAGVYAGLTQVDRERINAARRRAVAA
jgi:hypothetical protein